MKETFIIAIKSPRRVKLTRIKGGQMSHSHYEGESIAEILQYVSAVMAASYGKV